MDLIQLFNIIRFLVTLILAIVFGSVIFRTVKPERLSSMIIVGITSLIFGLFVVAVLGGPIGALTPFFLDPIGFIVSLVIVFVAGVVVVAVLSFVTALIDSPTPRRRAPRKEGDRTQIATPTHPKDAHVCALCSKAVQTPPFWSCRSCGARFCTGDQCSKNRRNLRECPKCGMSLRLNYHSP